MFQIFLYCQEDFDKGFIYSNVREIVRIRLLIDVPDFTCLNQVLIRILYKICKGTLMRVANHIDVQDFSLFLVSFV